MYRIVFICHGNICRSPMAEFVMRDLAEKNGVSDKLIITSRAVSTEELGNPVHRGTVRKLSEHGISCAGKYAQTVTLEELKNNDLIIYMDRSNLVRLERIARAAGEAKAKEIMEKAHGLKEYTSRSGDVADPWYTGNFDETWDDVLEGCEGLIEQLKEAGEC